ncbi:hypothetical protein OG607_24185 [Streptomyces sp. NBC_01537]
MAFNKIAPVAKPAPKHHVHKKAAPVKPVARKVVKKVRPRPIGN